MKINIGVDSGDTSIITAHFEGSNVFFSGKTEEEATNKLVGSMGRKFRIKKDTKLEICR